MSAAKHTTGTLIAKVGFNGDAGILDAHRNVVAECFAAIRRPDEQANDEALANARLYCAAPDMLDALRWLTETTRLYCVAGEVVHPAYAAAVAALAKAEGKV